ncbi:ABC transporter ATP-binding protein [Maritalea mediterranea]|uniref:ABC transporter ATP-binding protein n=1 Tax=Maritalea mediterranea TaxID=2909667 RepID=A0ABS9E6Q3_9HYPH|nr:ABC transporter ATP-binding protein [Maritalea mediterranea]MCF4097455.1 ABC transporter ATP-binding protein [Maritalea mediterranea]
MVEHQTTNAQQPSQAAGSEFAIDLKRVSKAFGPVQANKDIDLAVKRNSIHGIVGENGAGKSTLMSILYGFYTADSGEIWVNGQLVKIKDSSHALELGIGMVHQHFMLVENFTVLENIILGAEGEYLLASSMAKAREELTRLATDYGLNVDPDALIEDLSVGQEQRVEILKALYRGADVLILDEPTGVLTPTEADQLFRILEQLRDEGKTIILITHKLREIMAVTDTVSVMRQGEMVGTLATKDTSPEQLAELMVGRRVLLRVDKTPAEPKDVVLDVKGLSVTDDIGVPRVKDVSFNVRAGEIVGIAGVAGNGQSDLLRAISGMEAPLLGEIRVNGELVRFHGDDSASDARKMGVAHVPEDRLKMGLVTAFEEWENSILGYHESEKYGTGMFLSPKMAIAEAEKRIEMFDIRPRNPRLKTANFSGGNQQKIVLAREMDRDLDVLIVGQPTRGVDIGAIEFIHKHIIELRDKGIAVLLVSVELDEIRALSDRVLVMFDGEIVTELSPDASEREFGLSMAGVDPKEGA